MRESGPRTRASKSARNDADTSRDVATRVAASRRSFALSPANSALIEGSQGCTRLASARAVGVRTCGDSSATNASRASSDAAASDLDPESSPHRVSHVPSQRRYAPSAASATSSASASASLWSIAATSPSFSIQLLRSPSSVAASVRTEPAGRRASASGETAGAGGGGGMAASSAATSAAMSYLYAPTDSSVAEVAEETAFDLQSAFTAAGVYTAPSGRAVGTSYTGRYVAAVVVVVVVVAAAAAPSPDAAEAPPFQPYSASADDASGAGGKGPSFFPESSAFDLDRRSSPHLLVSLVNRAFVRSAALCSLAKVALTRCSNAAYGSGSGGGAPDLKSGARTNPAPGAGVANAVFPGRGGGGGGVGGGGIVDGANELPFEDDVAESLAESLAPGNAALTRRGPSKLPESVTTGARGSSSRVLFPNSSQALNPVLCIVTSLYSSVVVPGGSSTRPVQMFPSVHLSRNPSSGSHAPNTSASPTTPTCRPYGCLECTLRSRIVPPPAPTAFTKGVNVACGTVSSPRAPSARRSPGDIRHRVKRERW